MMINAPLPDVLSRLGAMSIGLSTMVDEHFGINIVEFMVRHNCPSPVILRSNQLVKAAEANPVTHASGGTLEDIVVPVGDERVSMSFSNPIKSGGVIS